MKTVLNRHQVKLWQLALLCLLTGLTSVLQVAMAIPVRNIIDAALSGGDVRLWGTLLAADILALILCHGLLTWLTGSFSDSYVAKLRSRLLRSAVYSRDSRLQDYHSGEMVSRGMEDAHTVCDGLYRSLPTLVGYVTRLASSFAALVYLSGPVALVMAVCALAVGIFAAALRPVLKKHHRRVRKADEQVLSAMQEDLQQLELIQSLGVQKPVLQRFDHRLDNSLQRKRARRIWSVGSNTVLNAVSLTATGALILWGSAQVAADALSYGSLTSMMQLLTLFRGPVLGISGVWTRLTAVEVASERLQDMLRDSGEEISQLRADVRAVVFEDVTFAYPGEETPVLEHFSLRFPLDGWVCLTGVSGRGKSTMFKLMLGLYAPRSGRVYLETPEGEIPCGDNTRGLFAYVPQDFALLTGSILENLQLVDPDATEETVGQALQAAQAEFAVDILEDTQVRENNTGLSKGQLQRLAVARALLMDRQILLLDECTSALDGETELALLAALRQRCGKAILVTHRPDSLSNISGITRISMK